LKFNVLYNGGREMKKLIVLFAILAMVNVASAGIVDLVISSLNGEPYTGNPSEITLRPTDWINVDVVYAPTEGMTIWSLSKEVVIGSPLEMTASIGGAVSTPLVPLTLTWAQGWNTDLSKVTMLLNGNPLIDAVATSMGTVAPGIVLDHFLFHCEMQSIDPFTIVLVETDATAAGVSNETDGSDLYELLSGPGITIHQIPEPMTLTLLGLGSLFLARRKK
jgi:hypothetical protein